MKEEVTNGVIIPQEAIDGSIAKKKAKRSLRQIQVYRDMANLKYFVVKLYDSTPRKLTKYIDTVLMTVSEAKKCVGLAEGIRDASARAEYYAMARIFVEDVHDDITILQQLGMIGNRTEKKMKSLAKTIVAQCVALRDYNNGEGVNIVSQ